MVLDWDGGGPIHLDQIIQMETKDKITFNKTTYKDCQRQLMPRNKY